MDFAVEELPGRDPGRARFRFTVRDTGIGIPDEFTAHVFEPFTRSANAARVEGTGLGLSIVKGLVELMRGGISIESAPGRGTVFCVELEFETAPDGDAAGGNAAARREEIPLEGRRFLIVEDNAINAEILCELLAMLGAGADVRTDGAQAVQAFREAAPGDYDAILMDIRMPVMNGYEAARAIRGLTRPDAGAIPIVAMTANAFAEDVQACLEAGMNAHVAKPIDIEVLRATLRRVLSGG